MMDLVRGVKERVYPGRPARLSQRRPAAAHQRRRVRQSHHVGVSHVQKTYLVKVNGALTDEQEEQFRTGVPLHGRDTAPAQAQADPPGGESMVRGAAASKGRKNQIRAHVQAFRTLWWKS